MSMPVTWHPTPPASCRAMPLPTGSETERRVADPTGTAIARPNGVLETDIELVAKYLPEKQDSDKDGTPDWQEWNAFGNLDHNRVPTETTTDSSSRRNYSTDCIRPFPTSSQRVEFPPPLSPGKHANRQPRSKPKHRGPRRGRSEPGTGTGSRDPDKADTDGDGFPTVRNTPVDPIPMIHHHSEIIRLAASSGQQPNLRKFTIRFHRRRL